MDFQVIWTEAALGEFEEAVRHLAEESEEAAERLRLEILNTIETLTRSPSLGQVYEKSRQRPTREIAAKRYHNFYRVHEADGLIAILTVWHSSRRDPHIP